MSTIVRTQAELDAAIEAGAEDIIIDSPAGAWIEICGSSTVTAYDSSTVHAWGSSTVTAYDSSTVTAWGSSTVTAWGSSTVTARGSSTVTAYDSSTVHARGSSTVHAGSHAAVHLHSGLATIRGGVLIDHTAVGFADPQAWCDYHGVPVADGIATVYKAVGPTWLSGYGTSYAPGSTPSAPDWHPRPECGNGLHFSPSPAHAQEYCAGGEARYLRVGVAVDQLVPLGDKCKAPAVITPCVEVDIHGREVRP